VLAYVYVRQLATLTFDFWHLAELKFGLSTDLSQQESLAIADKPARRESMPKIAPIRRAYNVVAYNTGLTSFV